MSDKRRVTVHKGPYATVRAIEKSGISSLCLSDASAISRVNTPVGAHIIAETERAYIYEVWATEDKERNDVLLLRGETPNGSPI